MRYLLILVLLLAGCSDRPTPPTAFQVSKVRQAAAADAAMAKTPVPMTYDINANQLLVIKVPTKDAATGVLEYQTCFVWRDAEYKAATLQCPSASVDFATQATNDVEGFN